MASDPVVSPPIADRAKTYVAWPSLICGLVATALSGYAYYIHLQVEAGKATGCSFGPSLSCDAVIGSKYGAILGIPLGVWGMVFFAIVAVTAVSTRGNTKAAAFQRLALASMSVGGSLALEGIMWGVLKVGCPVCMSIHLVALINFFFALPMYLRRQKMA